ncbi:MAG: EamA family transporter [Proteobacteria bacterium]|nr:EamA family transporter [Pseudomonadota bacterium]
MAVLLLTLVTLAYAGYNIFIRFSGGHASAGASTTILATLCLQAGAVLVSTSFLVFLLIQGGHSFRLTTPAYLWALAAGVCIGLAEVGYFYLFVGIAGIRPLPASLVVPTVVTGTVVIALLVSWLVLRERLGLFQLAGAGLIVAGILVMFLGRSGAARA